MVPVVRPRTLLLLATALTLLLNGLSLAIRLIATPAQRAGDEDAHGPFRGSYRLLRLLDADGEHNLPTWFSVVLLLLVALVCAGIAVEQWSSRSTWRWHWAGLALAFAYLSLDELAQLHDLASPVMARLVGDSGVLRFTWVVLAGPLVIAFALSYIPFLRALPRRAALLLVLSGAVYVGGALGLELLGSLIRNEGYGRGSLPYLWETTFEELLEDVGATLALFTVAGYAAARSAAQLTGAVRGGAHRLPDAVR